MSAGEIGLRYRVTGRRGNARRHYGATGICTWINEDEGRGNRAGVTVAQRIALQVDGLTAPIIVAASQVTEVAAEPDAETARLFKRMESLL